MFWMFAEIDHDARLRGWPAQPLDDRGRVLALFFGLSAMKSRPYVGRIRAADADRRIDVVNGRVVPHDLGDLALALDHRFEGDVGGLRVTAISRYPRSGRSPSGPTI